MSEFRLMVTSGWYSALSDESDSRLKLLGASATRRADFHEEWLASVEHHLRPENILIVDSLSPTPSPLRKVQRIDWIDLHENAGHATVASGLLCGWSQSVAISMIAFLNTGLDYYIYVEQDVLLKGMNLREGLTDACGTSILFGSGKGTPQPLQQSLFVLHRSRVQRFLTRFLGIPRSDLEFSPEKKFVLAASRLPAWVSRTLQDSSAPVARRLVADRSLFSLFRGFEWLPLPGGRARPIPWEADYYMQHASEEELVSHREACADLRRNV